MRQDDVKLLCSANERLAQANVEFSIDGDEDWKKKLHYQPRSSLLEHSVYNLNLILNNDPDFQNFAFNEMANRIQITGPLPWERPAGNAFWRDADTAQLKSIIDIRYLPFSSRNHDVAFTKAPMTVTSTLSVIIWIVCRSGMGSSVWKTSLSNICRRMIRNMYARLQERPFAAVARIYVPGIKFDCVPVLDGEQGIGKSTIVKDLVGSEYYSETLSLTDMDDKSGAEKLQGFWAVEIGELAGMKKADIEKVKAFLSTCDDKYRPSYGRVVESHPRQCIIIATVNGERGYLRDITGNRRFWIIKVHQKKQKKDLELYR